MNTKVAFFLALLALAGCTSASNNPEERGVREKSEGVVAGSPIDRHEAMSAPDGTPGDSMLEGARGVLGYSEGCLFLERSGRKTGLIMPMNASFDGQLLIYRQERLLVGQEVNFTGDLIAGPDRVNFACKTRDLLKVAP